MPVKFKQPKDRTVTHEIVVGDKRKHAGLVTMTFTDKTDRGARIAPNGIRWHIPSR